MKVGESAGDRAGADFDGFPARGLERAENHQNGLFCPKLVIDMMLDWTTTRP